MIDNKKIIYDIIMVAHKNKHLSYKKIVNIILDKYQSQFRNRNFFINLENIKLTDLIRRFFVYNPFQFSFHNDDINSRYELYDKVQTILTPNDNELISIGTGYIGRNGIFSIGMAAGFYTGDIDDMISQPFKPSFFFQNTSELLRLGWFKNLHQIYFTNASKIAVEKQQMNESYDDMYEKYWLLLEHELNLLQPRRILALGTNVYNFLKKKNIKCEKVYHPSYWIYRHQKEKGINYYKDIIKE